MRKLILLLCLIVLSCSVESEFEIQELNSDLYGISIKGSKNDKITICHFDADNNEWKTLNISQNAMPAHLNHGDAIDADGDGFFDRENGCSPVDCDDDDSEVGECPTFDLEDGLIAWYPFNGNANDESGNGNDGAVIGANDALDRFLNVGAYNFDGIDDYIEVSKENLNVDFNNLENAISISTWFSINEGDDFTTLISRRDFISNPNGERHHFWLGIWPDGRYAFTSTDGFIQNEIRQIGTLDNFILNSWHNLTITFDAISGEIKVYFDGNLQDSGNFFGKKLSIYNHWLNIGATRRNNGKRIFGFFNGKLDDFGIWNRALTDDEIQALYNETDSDLTN